LLLFIVGICYREEIRKKNRYKTKYFKWQRQSCALLQRERERAPAINNRILLYYIYCVKVSIPISRRPHTYTHTHTRIYRLTREYDELNAAYRDLSSSPTPHQELFTGAVPRTTSVRRVCVRVHSVWNSSALRIIIINLHMCAAPPWHGPCEQNGMRRPPPLYRGAYILRAHIIITDRQIRCVPYLILYNMHKLWCTQYIHTHIIVVIAQYNIL